MIRKIETFILEKKLFSKTDKILVALSGGADSVTLLHVLTSLGYQCEAAHCNFHLRKQEADRDELFVKNLCKMYNIYLNVIHFDTSTYASEQGISIEMAARDLRYEWFRTLKTERNIDYIAVGHHKDDSIETMLLNLMRGTGINGLLGIKTKNLDVVRPLLCVDRNEIVNFLDSINQDYVTDSSNLDDEYTRNKIRLNLIPLMKEIHPTVENNLLNTINHLSDAAEIYNASIEEGKKRVLCSEGINIDSLLKEPSPKALLFEIIYPLGFNSAQSNEIFRALDKQSGKVFYAKNYRIIKDRKFLIINKAEESLSDLPPFELIRENHIYDTDFVIPKDKSIACFDANKLNEPITIRKVEQGDWFIPFGMKGKKSVADFMTDIKHSILQKENQWLLCNGDEIAWVIGERIDNRFCIDNDTKEVVTFTIKQKIKKEL